MANWRQIQARIRKAKNSAEAPQKLAELFEKTHDAMVAFELGALKERAGENEESVRWYTTASERFRRAEWKKKAAEALARLGAPVPPMETTVPESEARPSATEEPSVEAVHADTVPDITSLETGTASSSTGAKRRRRGRRGGRGRRRKGAATPSLPPQSFARPAQPARAVGEIVEQPTEPAAPLSFRREAERQPERFASRPAEPARESTRAERAEFESPMLPSERAAHGRAGEPALASRLAHLESMLRRLVSSPLHHLDEADEAPAGPGVFLLSDSDLVTSYYIEACQTLRVGLGHLLRGGRGGRPAHPGGSLRARLAEHLGISESKVGDYLKKHCVVRWVQLDDEAPHFAHFVIGVLRTPLNAE
ncbi:MAG: hypothetical protein WBC04_14095 [Candidatus Acidiferrales bacterium]